MTTGLKLHFSSDDVNSNSWKWGTVGEVHPDSANQTLVTVTTILTIVDNHSKCVYTLTMNYNAISGVNGVTGGFVSLVPSDIKKGLSVPSFGIGIQMLTSIANSADLFNNSQKQKSCITQKGYVFETNHGKKHKFTMTSVPKKNGTVEYTIYIK
jgi:hypothetical protein